MRSLSVKLTLAFLLVGLTGAVLVAFLIRRSTLREFDRLVLDQNQQALVESSPAIIRKPEVGKASRQHSALGRWVRQLNTMERAGIPGKTCL